ncbi:hypothetical protein [Edaphobacter aggregans]|uniref:hypothetical protein n=1 Tax=Edaphobacter aggregans TaxID=570835 RepID=UPI000555340D|nr:hypothetical protein [Edaphobacter aggregans]
MMNFTPSSGAELQAEYFVPLNRAYPAILAVEQLRDRITPHLFVTELRTIAGRSLAQSLLPAPIPRHSLHLEARVARRQQAPPAHRKKLAPFDAPPLGKTLHHSTLAPS